MDMDAYDAWAVGLRRYLTLVAQAVGVGTEACSVHLGSPADAYIALDTRVSVFPARDAALLWDERHGWALAVETHGGADLMVVGYLGVDLLPSPRVVADYVTRAAQGGATGQPDPPWLVSGPAAAVTRARLAEYAGHAVDVVGRKHAG